LSGYFVIPALFCGQFILRGAAAQKGQTTPSLLRLGTLAPCVKPHTKDRRPILRKLLISMIISDNPASFLNPNQYSFGLPFNLMRLLGSARPRIGLPFGLTACGQPLQSAAIETKSNYGHNVIRAVG
jgi:hypothetical protein